MKEDKNSSISIFVCFFLAAIYLFDYIMRILGNQKFNTALSPLVPGGLTFEATQDKGFPYLLAGFIIQVGALAVALVAAYVLIKNINNGTLYSRRSAQCAQTIAFGLLGWCIGKFVENMGNNMAASRLGLDEEWGNMTVQGLNYVIVWMFLVMLFVLERSIKQAMRMKEEIDDLV